MSLLVKFPVDLRLSLDVKMNVASTRHTWTALVNNAGTLAHIVCPEGDFLIRLKFYTPLKSASPKYMASVITARLGRFITV